MGISLSVDQVVISALGCFCGDKNYSCMLETNLKALEITLQELEETRGDLLRRVNKEEDTGSQRFAQVDGWLSRVNDVIPQVNNLLEARSTETTRLCMLGYCSDCISKCVYGKKVADKLKEIRGLLLQGVFKVVADKIRGEKVEKKPIQSTVGLDATVNEAWDRLMSNNMGTLGLHGMGGVGKTTFLTRINNKFAEVENEFDVVMWVLVSKDMQYEGIQDQILRRLCLDKEWKQETGEEKARHIYNVLNRKKFVLLLDDLWSELDLNKIGVPFPTRENGSKIVLTTRSKEVCKRMEVDDEKEVFCLSPDEAWELFQKKVGEKPLKCHKDIPRIAREIADKCCGLPLAINVIGKTMACKETVQEWRHAIIVLISSSHEFPGMEEKILPILKFSYEDLKDEKVKTCFLYLSLFPEDYEIGKEELIEYWTYEGFIDGNGDKDAANYRGHDIIGSLLRAHLLMEGEFIPNSVKMHDVIREMSLWIGSKVGKHKEALFVKSGANLRHVPKDIRWKLVERISLIKNDIAEISCSFACPDLLTLLLKENKLVDISSQFFRFMPALVVLDLSGNSSLVVLTEEISNLGSLQYLNLASTGIQSLPFGFKVLRKLLYLNLESTHKLQSIVGIGTSLPNLQVLKIFHSRLYVDDIVMEELQLLEHLKILTANINDDFILESIQENDRLACCIRELHLGWRFSGHITLNTVALRGLQRLEIVESKITSQIIIEWESNEKSELPSTSYPGFKQLSVVDIFGLEGQEDLTWLMYAQDLKALSVGYSSSIKEIINREKATRISNLHPDIVVPFEKLELLALDNLDELKSICWNTQTLTNLKKFVGKNLPKLPQAATEFGGSEVEAHGMGE